MNMLALLFSHPGIFLVIALVLLYSVILHELAHGVAALIFRDQTALRAGRLTLNPFSHLDLVGSLMIFVAGFGWARPVPVDYSRLKPFRLGLFVVALAGCLTNILIATTAAFFLQMEAVRDHELLSLMLIMLVRINLALGAFNLIPIPPLDGSQILMSLLPVRGQRVLARIEPYGFGLLLILIMTRLLNPVIAGMEQIIMSWMEVVLRGI